MTQVGSGWAKRGRAQHCIVLTIEQGALCTALRAAVEAAQECTHGQTKPRAIRLCVAVQVGKTTRAPTQRLLEIEMATKRRWRVVETWRLPYVGKVEDLVHTQLR